MSGRCLLVSVLVVTVVVVLEEQVVLAYLTKDLSVVCERVAK